MAGLSAVGRKGLYKVVDVLVDESAKTYARATGNKMDEKGVKFIKAMVMSMIDLIEEAVEKGGDLDPRAIGALAFSRALATVGLIAEDSSWVTCGASSVALAVTTIDVFGIVLTAATASTTGAGAAVGIPVIFAAAAFYAYQVNDVVNTCGEIYVKKAEQQFESKYNVSSKKSMIYNYSKMVCRAPERATPVSH
jgi:hypothetical protein